jgi:hypothetical protein
LAWRSGRVNTKKVKHGIKVTRKYGQMKAECFHEIGSIGKRVVSELLDTIPYLRRHNTEPAHKQNKTP